MERKRQMTRAHQARLGVSAELKRLGAAKVDLTSWRLQSLEKCDEEFSRKVLEAASEALSLSVDGGIIAFFVPEGQSVDGATADFDPIRICLELPLGQNDLDNPTWAISLTDLVQTALNMAMNDPSKLPADRNRLLRRTRQGLLSFVAQIDQFLVKNASVGDSRT